MSVDNSRFGQQYLEKFGWTALAWESRAKAGRLSHISIGQKLNLLGIGGGGGGNNNHGDVSWKQNSDYELMLKRLNTTTAAGGDESNDEDEERVRVVSMVPDGFVRAGAGVDAGEGAGVSKVMDGKAATDVSIQEVDEDEKERKRLRKERKQRRREKAAAKAKAKAKAKANIENDGMSLDAAPFSSTTDTDTHRPYYHRRHHHRAAVINRNKTLGEISVCWLFYYLWDLETN